MSVESINCIKTCIREVKTILGNYYKENIYQSALIIELLKNGYICVGEVIVPIFYKNVYVGFERADIVIYDNSGEVVFILELKSQVCKLGNKETYQIKKYLNNLNCETGILVNFYEDLDIKFVTSDRTQTISHDNPLE